MKAVLIDVENCTVKDIEIRNRLEDYYKVIKARVITTIECSLKENHDLILDDECLLTSPKGFFSIDSEEIQFAGNGLIVSYIPSTGNWRGSKITAEEVLKHIHFWEVFPMDGRSLIIQIC